MNILTHPYSRRLATKWPMLHRYWSHKSTPDLPLVEDLLLVDGLRVSDARRRSRSVASLSNELAVMNKLPVRSVKDDLLPVDGLGKVVHAPPLPSDAMP